MAAVERAARLARIHAFISRELAAGYVTDVGERSIRLSVVQRQRIGIARALYKRASVPVFDEATSALDNETESAVMEAIEGSTATSPSSSSPTGSRRWRAATWSRGWRGRVSVSPEGDGRYGLPAQGNSQAG